MSRIVAELPKELRPFRDDLEYFVRTMVRKLYSNRHKGFSEGRTFEELLKLLEGEVEELKGAIRNEGQFSVTVEACDVANMAFLVAVLAWRMTRTEFDASRGGCNE